MPAFTLENGFGTADPKALSIRLFYTPIPRLSIRLKFER
jgi:hypothetical protein